MGLVEAINAVPVIGEFIPDKPKNLADTDAGKQATDLSKRLTDTQLGLPTPTYGTAPTVGTDPAAVAKAQAAYDAAQRALAAAEADARNATMGTVRTGGMAAGATNPDPYSSPRYLAAKEALNQAKAALDQAKAAAGAATNNLNTAKTTVVPSAISAQGSTAQGAQATGAGPVNATTISASPLDFATSLSQQARNNQIGQQAPIQTTRVEMPTGVTAQQFAAPTIGAAPMVTAERIGEMRVEGVPDDITLDGTIGRKAQLEALGLYRDAALGLAPSEAEQLLRKGTDENIGAAYGLAASLQGRNPGLALSTGVDAAGQAIARSSADVAALRAKEIETARAGLAALGSKISDQDFQVLASNQTKNLTVAITNLEAKLKTAIANQDAALRAGLGNQAAAVQTNIAQLQANLETLKANAQNSLTADIATMTAKLDASKANAANDLAARIQDSQNELTRQLANQKVLADAGRYDQADALAASIARMQAQLEADRSNQQALLDAAKTTASLYQQNNQFNAGLTQNNNQFNSSLTQNNNQFNANLLAEIQTGNANRDLAQQTINNLLYNSLTGNALAGVGVTTGMAANDLARQQQYDLAKTQLLIGGVKSLATGGLPTFGLGGGSDPVPYQTGPDGLMKPTTLGL